MAIIAWPRGAKLPASLSCAICKKDRTPSEVSAGLCNAKGKQVFACDGHFWLGHQFITGWASFVGQQRKHFLQKNNDGYNNDQLPDGAKNGWMLR